MEHNEQLLLHGGSELRIVESFPRAVRDIENVWIPMPDGCRLAARIWLPEDARERPVPAIVEYIPYRKRDGTRERDEPMHAYFAGHGYAAVRIDLRGSGESDGVLTDEYTEREHDDGVAAISWIASRDWCDGNVGMIGKSWGGFNALQIAALRPPALRAIITVCSTDDRYADDAHYMGGCLLNENLSWGSVLFAINAQPPDPEIVGERWRSMWLERLEQNRPFPALWLRHPTRDDYWKHGSVCEDFSRIRCPVYAVGGWADGYTNAVPRLLTGLSVPRKGLIGPWGHVYPHNGRPGPAIGFLQEALRWWDRWLRNEDNGIDREPALRVWMQESVPPGHPGPDRPGRWVAEPVWPSPRILERGLPLSAEGLGTGSRGKATITVSTPQTLGEAAGPWCGFGVEPVRDQQEDDRRSARFDSQPLTESLEILGAPRLHLRLSADQPVAFVVARLCEVFPDGRSSRVTYGLLNLTHRDGHERPRRLVPHEEIDVDVPMNDVAHAFREGHRIRLALSTTCWPLVWPSSREATLGVRCPESRLVLPVRPPDPDDAMLRPFGPPEAAPKPVTTDLHPLETRHSVERDASTGRLTQTTRIDLDADDRPALWRIDSIDLELGHGVIERFSIRDGDPSSAKGEITHRISTRRGDWQTSATTWISLEADAGRFRLRASLEAREGGVTAFRREWDESIPRRHL